MRDRGSQQPTLFTVDPRPATTVVRQPAYYRAAIRARLEVVNGRRSWDAYRDVFAPAYDDCRAATGDVMECIAVAVAMVEWVLGEPPPAQLRTLIARGVRTHGKAILYGYNEALARIDNTDDPTAMHRYALAVVRRIVREQSPARQPEQEHTADGTRAR